MDLSALLPLIDETVGLDRLRRRMAAAEPLVLGVSDGAKAAVIAALTRDSAVPALIVVPKPQHALTLAEELRAWLGAAGAARVLLFPERDALPYERLEPDPDDIAQRLRALEALRGGAGASAEAPIIVACAWALAQRTLSQADLAAGTIALTAGERVTQRALLDALARGGYSMQAQVSRPGEASRRGGIIDAWWPADDLPLRIELLGDTVESIRAFDPATQRSQGVRDHATLGPARDALAGAAALARLAQVLQPAQPGGDAQDRFAAERAALAEGHSTDAADYYGRFLAPATLLDHLPAGALVVVDEPVELAAVQEEHDAQAEEARREGERRGELPRGLPPPHVAWPALRAAIDAHGRALHLSRWATGEAEAPDAGAAVRLPFAPAAAYGGRLRALAGELAQTLRGGHQVVVVSTQSQRLAELLAEHDVHARLEDTIADVGPGAAPLTVVHGSLAHGWSVGADGAGLTLLTDTEVFGFSKQRRPPPRRGAARSIAGDLAPGEFVVHVEHGIARFAGLVRKGIAGEEREYLELHYADGDRLFVPTEQVDRVGRYVGPSEHRPALTRLGSQEWPRAKARVRRAVQDLAGELLRLYAGREVAEGHAFPPDAAWEAELEASFPYVETTDQQAAIRDVKRDMEGARPMDRLVCGDVGYGKTEVAVRAAFKAVLDGAQVAVLVPTTVLAQQHATTFRQRLAGFPVTVEMLSRFRSDREQRHIVREAAAGRIDILIGTHRLLQKDVVFRDLGLVIIDEEQRFGVAHKERLKQMRAQVDVLTLTATPIPRTLNMALTGIRDMSTIETPPEERLPIKTYVAEFDEHLVREAIAREMERGGQVYVVHNRVQNIELLARQLREIAPGAEVLVGHGQMPEELLERVMLDFTDGKADVLVCTTIIESGLDIPNVNTIIINNADRFGLAQLYQLRGRVGRGAARAYAYLLYEKHRALSEVAQRRLQTIFEATELGAGFQIALRDLEIRGAGNLLGAEQSGQIGAVGFDLYVKLLADAVEGLKALHRGEPPPPSRIAPPVVIDVPLPAFIPESYVADLNLRLSLYQRMAEATDTRAHEAFEREFTDRFGAPPPAVRNLLYVVRLRSLAKRAGVASVQREQTPGGRPVLMLRTADSRDLRAALTPAAQRTLAATGAVTLGHQQLRIDLAAAGDGWQALLLDALDAAGGAEAPVQVAAAP